MRRLATLQKDDYLQSRVHGMHKLMPSSTVHLSAAALPAETVYNLNKVEDCEAKLQPPIKGTEITRHTPAHFKWHT